MPTRRGNSEGSITRRPDGRWEARISLEGGKRKSLYGKTRQEAARKLAEALRDRDKGLPIVGERQTVAEYAAHWLETVGPTIGPSSRVRYEQLIRIHIVSALGTIALSKVTAQQVQQLYAKVLAAGLSSSTVHQIHGL